MILIPPPPQQPVVQKIGFDTVRVQVDANLTRVEVFRLIGQLERAASSA